VFPGFFFIYWGVGAYVYGNIYIGRGLSRKQGGEAGRDLSFLGTLMVPLQGAVSLIGDGAKIDRPQI